MSLIIGEKLKNGRYEVEKEVSKGYFDVSYLTKTPSGERWLIKVLDSDFLATLSPEDRDRFASMFRQEAIKLAKCSDTPHVVSAMMPFEENGTVCLPVEYLQGNDLGSRPQPILSEKLALKYIQQVGQALIVVHRQKLVHRDIRPSNIFLRIRDGSAEAVLSNFGLAVDFDTELTRTRRSELADGYSPVEMYSQGSKVGAYTDVYSLAATLYELLTGEMPLSAERLKQAEDKGVDPKTAIAPQVKNPDISGKTVRAIRIGMQLDPKKRPQSVSAWLSKLDLEDSHAVEHVGGAVNWTKWQAIWGAVAAIVSLSVGIPAWFAFRQPEVPSVPENLPTTPNSQAQPIE